MAYTKLGFGDSTPDYPEDTISQCEHCNEHHDNDGDYCSHKCWHLAHVGEIKAQILCWAEDFEEEKIIENMEYFWFESMTDSSVKRFKRAIHAMFEVKLAKDA